ncbi:MAG: S8 family serine peptidase [Aquabacterium sp.]|uniref:S8 family serine peptidase n=1 Tax=Aquabacterium sp. TaxID=1872578 RepID=UPI0025BD6613|nr:S8 family serine peptidase [Aquabacterium sp.]MBI5924366.1 S8 family serine peptidase [Aquabacterium sp.]
MRTPHPKPLAHLAPLAAAVATAGLCATMAAHAATLQVKETNDGALPVQWHLRDNTVGIGAFTAWAMAGTQPQTQSVVAVMDTNIELANYDLKNRLVTGWDARNNTAYPTAWLLGASLHGTWVSTVVAAEANNGSGGAGVAGPAPVKVMPLKYVNEADMCGASIKPSAISSIYTATARALRYGIDNNAKVINISSGVTIHVGSLSAADRVQFDQLMALFKEARDRGILVVTAAGNLHYDADRHANERLVMVKGWDTLPDGTNECAAPRYSLIKWESDLNALEAGALQSGQAFSASVTAVGATGASSTYPVQVQVATMVPKGSVMFPAGLSQAPYNLDNIVTVGGSGLDGKMWVEACPSSVADFAKALGDTTPNICAGSTYGKVVDLVAPAKDVYVLGLNGAVSTVYNGTSFATPMVSGAAGLALTVRPNLTAAQLKAALTAGVNKDRIRPGVMTTAEILNMPRMLSSPGIGIVNTYPPGRTAELSAPTWSSTARTYTFNDTVTTDDKSLVRWSWDFGDGTTAQSTTRTITHPFALNGAYKVGVTVYDNEGNTRVSAREYKVYGSRRDLVTLSLAGAQPYAISGDLVSGNLSVAAGVLSQRKVTGTGVLRNGSGQNVTVTFDVSTNWFGGGASGTITVKDPVRGTLTAALANGTLSRDVSIDQAVGSFTGQAGAFTGASFTVRDTDD